MKPSKEQLLNDVIADEDYLAFRRILYHQSLAQLRRRRSERLWHQLQALAACAVIAIGLLFLHGTRTNPSQATSGRCEIVHSLALQTGQVVATTGLDVDVVSTRLTNLTPTNEQFALQRVRTASSPGGLEYISDGQLLDLFEGQQVALIPGDQGGKRLCFLDPAVRALFVDDDRANSL